MKIWILGIMRLCVELIAKEFLDVKESGGLKPLSLGFQRWKGVTFIRDGLFLEVCVVGELFNREVLLCKQVRASVVPLSHQWTSGHIKCTCCNLPTAPPPPPAENTINAAAAAAISFSSWYFLNRQGWARVGSLIYVLHS